MILSLAFSLALTNPPLTFRHSSLSFTSFLYLFYFLSLPIASFLSLSPFHHFSFFLSFSLSLTRSSIYISFENGKNGFGWKKIVVLRFSEILSRRKGKGAKEEGVRKGTIKKVFSLLTYLNV